jgi:hypothetical protein
MRRFILGVVCCGLVAIHPPATAEAPLTVNLSGTESSTGRLAGDSVTGVRFQGWLGGSGPNANGWSPPPGDGGRWLTRDDYVFESDTTLSLTAGSFDLMLPGGHRLSATATAGVVTRPDPPDSDLGCGAGRATLSITLAFDDGAQGGFTGCLDDGRRQPFRLWGTLTRD